MHGCFSVQLGDSNPCGRIPIDQTIEETVNKDTQTPGGTKGFSLKPGAVAKYYMTTEYRIDYLRKLRDTINQGNLTQICKVQESRRMRDVQSLVDLMENEWLNPMCPEESDLIRLSTGVVAPPNITNDLLRAYEIGELQYQCFKDTLIHYNTGQAL